MSGSLSIAMIVRDEAEVLGECLAGVASVGDEVCVVDTGSTDDTVAIAEDFGARVKGISWSNDFAAARNTSLEMCRCDWIFILDADERLAQDDAKRLKGFCDRAGDRCFRFTTRTYSRDTTLAEFYPCRPDDPYARGHPGWYPSTKVRLFPNDPRIRFEGAVHELVNAAAIRAGYTIVDSDIPIHHYPYLWTSERVEWKKELYLRLGREKVASNPNDSNAHAELGAQLVEMERFAEAIESYRRSLRLQPDSARVLSDLGAVLFLLSRHDEARRALELAVKADPKAPDAWRNTGIVLARLGELSKAEEAFRTVNRLRPSWPEGLRGLSLVLEDQGRHLEAAAISSQAVEASNGAVEQYIDDYVRQMTAVERVMEARQALRKIRDMRGSTDPLDFAIQKLEDTED